MDAQPQFKFTYIAQLLVSDVASAANWYEEHFGLAMGRVCRHGDRLTYAHMTHAGRDCLLLHNLSALQDLGYLPKGVSFNGLEIKVKVDGLEALHQHLAIRLPDLPAIAMGREGQNEFKVRDSNGYVLVFCEQAQ